MSDYDVYFGKATDAELKGFMIEGGVVRGLNQYLVNSYAQKVGAGDRQFQDNSSFDYWTVKNWSAGFGHKNPEDGFLYAHADTRFPEQALLPLEPSVPGYLDTPHGGHDYEDGSLILYPANIAGPTQATHAMSSFYNTSDQGSQVSGVTIKIKAPNESWVTVGIWTLDIARYPDTLLNEAKIQVLTDRPVAEYVSINMPQTTILADTEYGIVISCDEVCELYHVNPYSPKDYGVTQARVQVDSQWQQYDYTFQFVVNTRETATYLTTNGGDYLNISIGNPSTGIDGDWFITNQFGRRIIEYAKAGGKMYAAWGSFLDLWDDGTGSWINVYDTGGPAITDIIEIDDKILVALGPVGMVLYDPIQDTEEAFTEQASLLHIHKGYLYRAFDNEAWYATNLTQPVTWQGPFTFCRAPYQIRGMASMGEYPYFACDERLYYLGPGDFVHQLAEWPSIDGRNGRGMASWLGNLYVPLAEDVVQYTEAGVMLQMGFRVGEGLPKDLQGNVFQLIATNYFLLAIIDPGETAGAPSVWAYNQSGWHNIVRLPQGIGAGALYLDTTTNWLWIGSGLGISFRASYPPAVVNPIRDFSSLTFCREGWVEFDEFDGRLLELIKDAEAIYINGEFIEDSCCLGLYWQEEDDTDWQYLGQVTDDNKFTRWADYTERPEFRTIRLGISLRTNSEHSSPIVRAHMLKFLAIVTDRHGWQARLLVSDFDEDLAAQIGETQDDRIEKREFLKELETSVHPVVWQDIDAQQYEVRITAANRNTQRYEKTANGGRKFDSVHIMTIEQVTDAPLAIKIPVEDANP